GTVTPTCLFCLSSRRRHTRSKRDWSSDVCSSDLLAVEKRYTYTARCGVEILMFLDLLHKLESGEIGIGDYKVTSKKWGLGNLARSEERRVGKEGRARSWAERHKKERETIHGSCNG